MAIISNATDFPVSLDILEEYGSTEDYRWLTTYNKEDTLSLDISASTWIICHSPNSYPDTTYLSPGDTIFIELNEMGLNLKSTDFLQVEKYLKDKDLLEEQTDSLFSLIVSEDPTKAMDAKNDLSKVKLIPQSLNDSIIKDSPQILEKMIGQLLNQLERQSFSMDENISPEKRAMKQLKLEVYRNKAYKKLRALANLTKNPEIISAIFNSDLFKSDGILDDHFGDSYLKFFITDYVLNGEKDRSRSRVYINYKEAYDKLPDFLEGDLLKATRQICFAQMIEYGESRKTINSYLSNFYQQYNDSTFVESFKKRYLLAYDLTLDSERDLELISNTDSVFTLSGLIQNDPDSTKYYYLDFWASWCAPCRKAMPFSQEKRHLFEDKGVKFIYLSMDRDRRKWETASLSHHLETYENSYLLINPQEQQFLNDLKIDFIPRYILLNSEGKVIEPNAPGPEGESLNKTLLNYLNSNK